MTGNIAVPANVLAGLFCGTCGQAKINRLHGYLTGCPECDEIATRHRCTARPALSTMDTGASWECPDCGSVWTAVLEEDTCGECGRSGMEPAWSCQPGPRAESAPRRQPGYTPMRNIFPRR